MLFCLLHPMDHNTGPLARKSTTLCALLLVSIAALLVLAVPEQAKVEEVGVAKHTLDGDSVTLKEGSKPADEGLTYAEYVKRFPTVCKFSITPTHIELLYEGEWCTVELITNIKNMIKLTTGYLKDGCKLDECDVNHVGDANFENGFSNLLPFAYSKNNNETGKLKKGPIFDGDDCDNRKKCGENKKCMKETFLEVSWSACLEGNVNYVYAHTHLIGEVSTGMDQGQKRDNNVTKFNLEIHDNSFKMVFNRNLNPVFDPKKEGILCVPKESAIVRPKTWSIKNEDKGLKGKHLLVFHLLPQTATIRYKNERFNGTLKEKRPKCNLFIHFARPDYEFLQVDPQTTTTSTTTTATTTTTNPDATSPPAEKTSTSRPQQETTTKAATTTTTATKEGSKIWIWAIVFFCGVLVFCLLIAAGAYRGYIIYEDQQKKKTRSRKTRSRRPTTENLLAQCWRRRRN
uniref:Uncharacterized protein n=1 Tax=Meloidogyne incognita TaxID=6306 RepID=A0A914NLE2_MELIC